MTAHVCSWVLQSDLEFLSSFFDNKQKMLTFKIFWQYLGQNFTKLYKNEYLLRNFQDGISRPLGSLEIKKTNVLTALPDTKCSKCWDKKIWVRKLLGKKIRSQKFWVWKILVQQSFLPWPVLTRPVLTQPVLTGPVLTQPFLLFHWYLDTDTLLKIHNDIDTLNSYWFQYQILIP